MRFESSNDVLLSAWAETLARKGDAPAIFARTGEVSRTFHQIEEESAKFADELETFSAGAVLAVQIGNHPSWPAVLLGCLRKGAVVLPLEQSISIADRDAAVHVCGAVGIVLSAPDGNPEVRPVKASAAASPSSGTVLLKLTSGTTAAPRAVRFRSEQLLADCHQICGTMGIGPNDLNFGVIPVSHSYGFSNLLTPLIARGVPMVLSSERLPRAVLADLARTNATVFPGMPVFYQAFCDMPSSPDLPRLRLCISAGAPLPAALARSVSAKFGRSIHSFYGSSECGGICYDREGVAEEDGYVGEAMDEVELQLVDPGAVASQIEVRSAAVAEGYFPVEDESVLAAGRFIPGDLLARSGAGLKIVGRVSDLINVAGRKVNPAHIEAELLRINGVRDAVVFGRKSSQRNEEVAACVVTEGSATEAELLRECRLRLSGWQVPKRIFIVDRLPINERGKTSRRQLADRFAN